ncbi:MAG: murein L,D-transpeptidase catalytic domain family protein [Chitinophagaceae bacterium]|nr:murein L,D-transpeptidase catalytic domain family protein [Chitinophagaceae bacterium]
MQLSSASTKAVIYFLLAFILAIFNKTNANDSSFKIPNHKKVLKSIEKESSEINLIYSAAKLSYVGLPLNTFALAMKGFSKLRNQNLINADSIITIIDFEKSSSQKRLYVVDLKTKSVLFQTLVAHGKNSGKEYARSFSNEESSYKSSLGFYITRNTYEGSNGYSLRLEGTENGINNKALERAIVMHGAGYASESTIYQLGFLGRSWGCPALPESLNKPIINKIKDGNMLFIYYPDQDYLKKSSILNS